MEAIRTALTSTVSMDITVINNTLDTLEKILQIQTLKEDT